MRRIIITTLLTFMLSLLVACSRSEQGTSTEITASDCDAAEATCHVMVAGKRISLTLGPGVTALKPFSIEAQIRGTPYLEKVIIDFQMVGMEMGINRYRLKASEKGWRGEATLPVCTASRTDWLAVLEFQLEGKGYRVLFPFTAQK